MFSNHKRYNNRNGKYVYVNIKYKVDTEMLEKVVTLLLDEQEQDITASKVEHIIREKLTDSGMSWFNYGFREDAELTVTPNAIVLTKQLFPNFY